jgi:hypothetical protein
MQTKNLNNLNKTELMGIISKLKKQELIKIINNLYIQKGGGNGSERKLIDPKAQKTIPPSAMGNNNEYKNEYNNEYNYNNSSFNK